MLIDAIEHTRRRVVGHPDPDALHPIPGQPSVISQADVDALEAFES